MVFLACLIIFRSPPGALCVVIPLFITTILAEALMSFLGIGVKALTLPVIAGWASAWITASIFSQSLAIFYDKVKISPRPATAASKPRAGPSSSPGPPSPSASAHGFSPHQVSSRYGPAAHIHVSRQHGRRALPHHRPGQGAGHTRQGSQPFAFIV